MSAAISARQPRAPSGAGAPHSAQESAVGAHSLRRSSTPPEHLQDFIAGYSPDDHAARAESERFRRFGYEELVARDKASLDIIWLRDDSLEDTEKLPPPEVIAQEIIEDLEAALTEFTAVAQALAKDDAA